MNTIMQINMAVDVEPSLNFNVDIEPSLNFDVDMAIHIDGTPYTGQTTVIPSALQQTLQTAGTLLLQNITIEPIPSNYGLITWNGATLTVS